ncbi:MAG: hypothetical protein Q8P17_02105 [bacterium]|nr:hypothetical protein [bacterium]
MNFVPVQMFPRKGVAIVLRNFAMGSLAWIDCLYVVKGPDNPRQAKKVATALNAAIEALDCGDYFSGFSVKVLKGEFPIGAKVIDAPLRGAAPARVRAWIEKHLPPPIQATDYDGEVRHDNLYREFPFIGRYHSPSRVLDGEPCSVQ